MADEEPKFSAGEVFHEDIVPVDLFAPSGASASPKESWDLHVIEFVIRRGEGEGFGVNVECKGADNDNCACTADDCQVQFLWKEIGTDGMKAAGEISLAKVSARIDWSDPEEPWVELEP